MRRKTQEVQIGNIKIGGSNPILIQTMTNTDTAKSAETFEQIRELVNAGAELVRVTVMDKKGAAAVPKIKELMIKEGYNVPLIGDFHYIGHELLEQVPMCAIALDKYRINPGNVGQNKQRDINFYKILEIAKKNKKAIRIGVNAGSINEEILTVLMDRNAKLKSPRSPEDVFKEAMIKSAIDSTEAAIKYGIPKNKIVVSVKVSDVNQLIEYYQEISKKTDYCLHLGLTEAGQGDKGIVASSSAIGILLNQGIGDTIRVSLTPTPTESRAREVKIARLILQTMGFRQFQPLVTSCPGCGRTSSDFYQKLALDVNSYIEEQMVKWKIAYPGVEALKIAVMGCVVNGPGESKHADIGISLPGKAENPIAPVIIDGKHFTVLKGEKITEDFKKILSDYVKKRFG
jgi:(E)-4-hydroxy-3-methylbut-2-enyl-diphosphate synthase